MTLVYEDNGDTFLGEMNERSLKEWEKMCKEREYKYLYKASRSYRGKVQDIIIFSDKKWDKREMEMRISSGLHFISEHKIKNKKKDTEKVLDLIMKKRDLGLDDVFNIKIFTFDNKTDARNMKSVLEKKGFAVKIKIHKYSTMEWDYAVYAVGEKD